ncbi:uncharacterized protein LOC124918237 isoform X2 [Impatiens glandulifera]|uniref:uncharacterized protein LOC124918237 isoform X2 n=2 Tax=Impatiens glandulifera TaxID=253017 RepID=UPI001FB1960C|nr:uncharacterized protein LOC124918237 isoform X2 [Impatiens glandulifera]
METTTSVTSTSSCFVSWEEFYVSNEQDKRKKVYYYLKCMDGSSDLAVVGRERSLPDMPYHYSIRNSSLLSNLSSKLKLRSRKDVVKWLDSIVSGSHMLADASLTNRYYRIRSNENPKSADFSWFGVPWTCKKRRTHYQSFCSNNVKISAHDIVYVMDDENKRLVAHLVDMYEDPRGIRMVAVQWFHKIDEVGMVLPQNYNNREVFFSLCEQHLSIECIDGLASVLSPLHYEKFSKMTKHDSLEPFFCQKLFDNGEIKPYNITQLKGYWRQATIGHLYSINVSNDCLKSLTLDNHLKEEITIRPKKRLHQSKDTNIYFGSENGYSSPDCLISSGLGSENSRMMEAHAVTTEADVKEDIVMKPLQHLVVGSAVEVLSQDSGIRGCWFKSVIIKKHKNKVKVRYIDIMDAEDESKLLEEWILASKIANPDAMGVRLCERPVVRPSPPSKKGVSLLDTKVGGSVDVWWHDGWWEGIILQKYSEDKIHIYFPGENKESCFTVNDLRHSCEWLVSKKWEDIRERPDLAISILSGLKNNKEALVTKCVVKLDCALQVINNDCTLANITPELIDAKKVDNTVCDLSKDALLADLKWNSSGKRSRSNLHHQKMCCSKKKRRRESVGVRKNLRRLFDSNALDDNCKFLGESRFSSTVVPIMSM